MSARGACRESGHRYKSPRFAHAAEVPIPKLSGCGFACPTPPANDLTIYAVNLGENPYIDESAHKLLIALLLVPLWYSSHSLREQRILDNFKTDCHTHADMPRPGTAVREGDFSFVRVFTATTI